MSTEPSLSSASTPARGWICFDGNCGICRALADRYRSFLARRGYLLVELQNPSIRSQFDLSEEEYLRDIRLVRPDGTKRAGAEVYRDVLWSTPWLMPLAAILSLPGFSHAMAWAYRTFADNRHRMSTACGLPSSPPSQEGSGSEKAG